LFKSKDKEDKVYCEFHEPNPEFSSLNSSKHESTLYDKAPDKTREEFGAKNAQF